MISKMLRITLTIAIASLLLSSAAGAATCSNASLSGTYGFLHDGTGQGRDSHWRSRRTG
jgi:hypothetical protein